MSNEQKMVNLFAHLEVIGFEMLIGPNASEDVLVRGDDSIRVISGGKFGGFGPQVGVVVADDLEEAVAMGHMMVELN